MPDWVKDKDKWERAKEEVDFSKYDEPYAVVTEVYKNMGGEIKKKSKVASEDWFKLASDQRIEEINKQLKHVGWNPRNPNEEELDLTRELDNLLRRTGKDYMDLPFYARISYFHWKYPDVLDWAERSFHEVYNTPWWKLLLVEDDILEKLGGDTVPARTAITGLRFFQDLTNELRSRAGDAIPEGELKYAQWFLDTWEKEILSKTQQDYEEHYQTDFSSADKASIGGSFSYWIPPRKKASAEPWFRMIRASEAEMKRALENLRRTGSDESLNEVFRLRNRVGTHSVDLFTLDDIILQGTAARLKSELDPSIANVRLDNEYKRVIVYETEDFRDSAKKKFTFIVRPTVPGSLQHEQLMLRRETSILQVKERRGGAFNPEQWWRLPNMLDATLALSELVSHLKRFYNSKQASRKVTALYDYYRIPKEDAKKVTVEDVEKAWREERDKLYDVNWVEGRYQLLAPLETLKKYREYDRAGADAYPHGDSEERIQKIVESIKEKGWTTPVHVTVSGTGRHPPKVTEGNHRLIAAERLGIDYVPVVFFFHS